MTFTLAQLAELVSGEVVGNSSANIRDIAEIQNAKEGELTFLANKKYTKYIETTNAEAIIVSKDFTGNYKNLIKVENPNFAFSLMIAKFRPETPLKKPGIHKSAIVSKKAILGSDIFIGPNVIVEDNSVIENGAYLYANSYIGQKSRIGAKSIIYSNVTVYHGCKIGANCIIHSGTVIGSDGFGFVRQNNGISKIPQSGGVEIGQNVEIGSNCSIDRGTIGNTCIGYGTKLDNLIQVAHNVKIGTNCFIAGQTGIAGSTRIGNSVTVAAQVGITGHIKIGDGAIIGGKSGITKDIAPGEFWFGYPATLYKEKVKEIANIRLLPDFKKRLKKIEELLKEKDK